MSVRIVSTPLAGSTLAQLGMSTAASPWYVRRPATSAEWRERAEMIRSSLLVADWKTALEPAIAATGQAAERLERAAENGFVVTSGQQPGLFGGPLYTWWKAMSALALADHLEAMTGLPVAPVFWAATDDSDFDEASGTAVATADGAEKIEIDGPAPAGASLAEMRLGDIDRQLTQLATAAGSAASSAIMEIVRDAYRPGQTIGGAYVALLRAALEPYGVAVIDAAHSAVRRTAHPILDLALSRGNHVEVSLAERARELRDAGHSPQVRLVKGRTLVFSDVSGRRDRIRLDSTDATARLEPGSLGPNVLLRPVVERSILPAVAYLGGPAEVSYFAQVSAVADALEVPTPLVLPRWSGYVIEPRIEKILERYSLDAEEFHDPHAVETRLARESLPVQLKGRIAEMKDTLELSAAELAATEGADLVPLSVIQGLRRNITHRLERLERRYAAVVKRRGNEALRDAAIARGALYPFGSPQERALNFVPLYARYGEELLSGVLSEARRHAESLA